MVFKKGYKPWNLNLTKETDERVRKSGEKNSISLKERIPWSKGLTKYTDERLKKAGLKVSKTNTGRKQSIQAIINFKKTRQKRTEKQILEENEKISQGLKQWYREHVNDPLLKERRVKISKSMTGKPGHFHTKETKKKQGISIKKSWQNPFSKLHTKERSEKISIKQINHFKTVLPEKEDKRKEKIRIALLKRIKLFGMSSLGKNEKQILDKQEILLNIKILRHYSVAGYSLDGYSKDLNIAFEVDERYHYNYKGELRECDIKRQKIIEKRLGCSFIRIKDY